MLRKTKQDWESEREDLIGHLRDFSLVMQNRPFQNVEGLRGVSAFALYYFLRQVKPTAVFEVGVWRGFSTWLIEQAVPQAQVYCFDPIFYLAHILDQSKIGPTYRSPRARYFTGEFSCSGIQSLAAATEKPLAFFDDHQDCLPRLFQAKSAGIKHLMFDDNDARLPYSHLTLDHELRDPQSQALLDREVAEYQVFPALWDVDVPRLGIHEDGLHAFPVDEAFSYIFQERQWHSSVTYLRLNEESSAAPAVG